MLTLRQIELCSMLLSAPQQCMSTKDICIYMEYTWESSLRKLISNTRKNLKLYVIISLYGWVYYMEFKNV